MMQKLVTLQLDGDLTQQGFQVLLAVGPEGQRPTAEVKGFLPPAPDLEQQLCRWQTLYRRLGHVARIKPQQIVYVGAINLIEDCRQVAAQLATSLSAWLTAESFWAVDRLLREALNREDRVRILLRTDNPQLHQLPWHLWDLVDRYPHAEVAMTAVSFERITIEHPQLTPRQVRVLAIVGHSAGLDTEVDRQLLTALPHADVTLLVEPQRQQFNDRLWEQPWDILFFAGHSQTQALKGHLSINPNDTLTLEELQYGLRRAVAQGLQLAIFNSCDGLGLAYALEQVQLPQMIVMREPLPDPVAHAFLKYFLDAFAQGAPLYLATRQARERLQGLEREFPCASWLPVIFQHPAATPPDWQGLLGLPPPTVKRQDTQPARGLKQRRAWQRYGVAIALCSTIITGLTLGIRWLGGLTASELWAYDTVLQLRPPERQDDRLLIVTIDDADIRYQAEQGMTLNHSLAPEAWQQLLTKLQALEPHSVGLDVYRTSPIKLQQTQWPLFAICKVPAPDGGDPDGVDPPPDVDPNYVGFSDFTVDQDEVLRRHLLALKTPSLNSRCTARNAFSLLLTLHYLETKAQVSYDFTANREFKFGDVIFKRLTANAGGYQHLDAGGYQLLLNYRLTHRPHGVAPTLRLRDLLDDQVPAQTLKQLQGRIVLVGVTAPSSRDDWLTPLSRQQTAAHRKSAGIVIQAQMISQLLSAVQDQRPLLWWWPEGLEVLWIWGWAIVGGLVGLLLKQGWLQLGVAIASLVLLTTLCYLFILQAGWIPLIPAILALLASLVAITQWRQRIMSQPLQ